MEPYQSTIPDVPSVSLRGDNVVGTEREYGSGMAGKVTLWKVAVPTFFFVIAALVVTWRATSYCSSRHRKPNGGSQ